MYLWHGCYFKCSCDGIVLHWVQKMVCKSSNIYIEQRGKKCSLLWPEQQKPVKQCHEYVKIFTMNTMTWVKLFNSRKYFSSLRAGRNKNIWMMYTTMMFKTIISQCEKPNHCWGNLDRHKGNAIDINNIQGKTKRGAWAFGSCQSMKWAELQQQLLSVFISAWRHGDKNNMQNEQLPYSWSLLIAEMITNNKEGKRRKGRFIGGNKEWVQSFWGAGRGERRHMTRHFIF